MYIYKVSVSQRGSTRIWSEYYGVAKNAREAQHKALRQAKKDRIPVPHVTGLELVAKADW